MIFDARPSIILFMVTLVSCRVYDPTRQATASKPNSREVLFFRPAGTPIAGGSDLVLPFVALLPSEEVATF